MEEEEEKNLKQNITGGYLFLSAGDAALARREMKKALYLEEHMDYNDMDTVLKVYQKALESRAFQTPHGLAFVYRLREHLLEAGYEEETVGAIPIYQEYTRKVRSGTSPARERIRPAKTREKIDKYKISVLLNLLLTVLVAGMLYLARTGDNPNILNYERAVVDKYAAWEQELTERENALREKELLMHSE